MRDNNLGVELQRTLNELSSDLFATTALDDCNAILQSLAMLADTFPEAQTILGRLFSQNESGRAQTRYNAVSKLSALSSNFLYQPTTARSAVSLLAALANENLRNQQRIAHNVTGVVLEIDPTKFDHARDSLPTTSSTLFALTVPARVTGTYRRWRKRQRKLQKCRLPTGVPPSHDGIPMPCYCDRCLGSEQLLSTWQQHFHDLSRWVQDTNKKDSRCRSSSSLSAEEFFRLFLKDHRVLACSIGAALGNQKEAESSGFDKGHKNRGLLYYFVSPEEFSGVSPRALVQFNPLFHVSAIAIAPEIDVRRGRLKAVQQGATINNNSACESLESAALANQQVILFFSTTEVESCTSSSAELQDSDAVGQAWKNLPVPTNDDLRTDFYKLEERHGQLVQYDSLTDDVSSDECDITATTRQVLLRMISFCERDDHIPLSAFRQNFCPLVDTDNAHDEMTQPRSAEFFETTALKLNTRAVVTAHLAEQILQIDCFPTAAENTVHDLFSTRIPQRKLMRASKTGDSSTLDLICLSDEALESLIERCRVCTCGNPNAHEESDSIIFLKPSGPDGELAPDNRNEIDDGLAPENTVQTCTTIRVPVPGLSSAAKRDLAKLEILVSEEKYHKLTSETLTALKEKLSRVIADCNERISYLSTARDKNLLRAAPEAHRAAAISRCRHCRDLLIQLGKKIALQVRPLDNSAVISLVKLSRLAKIIRASVQDALVHSEAFDPWETPDARVEKLHLDRRLWASGFPDAAYYQDTDTRQRENRKQQQHLSRKLLVQQKKQSSEKTQR